MRYVVWVENADGSGKITLTSTEDGDQASELVATLVRAASGVSLAIGVTVTGDVPVAERGARPTHAPAPKR